MLSARAACQAVMRLRYACATAAAALGLQLQHACFGLQEGQRWCMVHATLIVERLCLLAGM